MLFRKALMTAGVAALAIPAMAGGPIGPQQLLHPGTKLDPIRARGYTIVDGRMVWTTDWISLGGPSTRSSFTAAWDSAELEVIDGVIGTPTDNTPGCQWSVALGSRWYGGPTYNNPFVSNDMTTDAAGQGQQCTAVGLEWFWNVGPNEVDNDSDGVPDAQCIIAVQTFEDMDVSAADLPPPDTFDDGSGFIDGVVYDFGFVPAGNGYYYSAPDLTGSGLFHTMPADGDGGYQLLFGMGTDPDTGDLILPVGIDANTGLGVAVQPMSWGCGANEVADADGTPQPDGRVGTQDDGQYDDDAPTNGIHDVDDTDPNFLINIECYSYAAAGLCPNVLGSAVAFYYKGNTNPCGCVGDLDGDGDRDISDLAIILSQFGSTGDPGSLGCADIDADGDVDISDLASALSVFGVPC